MGADIHCLVEKKIDGVWTLVHPKVLVEYRSEVRAEMLDSFPGVLVDTYEEGVRIRGEYREYSKHPLYIGRDYDLFTILADVRSRDLRPISAPKGVPWDASHSYTWLVENWRADGHSHSWFTLAELLDYNWPKAEYSFVGVRRFVEVTIPALQQLGDPDDVRICFFFDN